MVGFHRRVMSNADRVHRGFTAGGSCKICTCASEDVEHIFRICDAAVSIWNHFLPPKILLAWSSLSFDAWVRTNLGGEVCCGFTSD